MAICHFCKQQFANRQAVRAHLKGCVAYQGRGARQFAEPYRDTVTPTNNPPPAGSTSPPVDDFDPVRQMRQSVAAEQLRLKLREIQRAHSELDARAEAKCKEAADDETRERNAQRAAEEARELTRMRVHMEAEARRRAEEARHTLRAKRREVINTVKNQVVEHYFPRIHWSSGLKAQILQAIEARLVPLPVEELPQSELVQIAESVRDDIYNGAVAAQNAAAAQLQKKHLLYLHGFVYTRKELRNVEGLNRSERSDIESRVLEELTELTGDESRADVMAWVDEILEEEGLEFDDGEQDEVGTD